MVDEQNIVDNFGDLIDKIVIQYNKGIILDFVTTHSFKIIDEAMDNLQDKFGNILSAFEEIQKESSSSASNASYVDEILSGVLEKRNVIQEEIHEGWRN